MSVYATAILGHLSEERFKDRRAIGIPVAWDEASRRRLRRTAVDGTDVAIDLPDGSYLADGSVVYDDGERVLAIERPAESALVVRFDPSLPRDRLIAQAVALGHAFGNQHVPLEVTGGEVRIPLTTSESVARATVDALALDGAATTVADVSLGSGQALSGGAGHAHDHT